ncbi:MAG: glycosyltransferase family 2 protein [Anaerolineales bacterium]|nr:glycosyltransferase family 2 protein [Anaerolineales bacterium]
MLEGVFCSTIIPTIGRETLGRAVESVLAQAFNAADFEVIVVNDSGRPLPPAAWQDSPRVRVLATNRRERCFARNSGAAAACGQYLHFLDDDDWLLPGALQALWRLAQQAPHAGWLYGRTQLVDRLGAPLIQLHHGLTGNAFVPAMAGEWIPMQASLIAAEAFFAVGGFHPLTLATQDVHLLREIALRRDVAETPVLVACVGMGAEGSSTDKGRASDYSRRARELVLAEAGVFARLRAGAGGDAYWHGRVTRLYLTSAVWNLRRRRVWPAASRLQYALLSVLLAGPRLAARAYWQAVARPHESFTFRRGYALARGEGGGDGYGR